MGLAQAGTTINSGDNLMVQGIAPSGIAVAGNVVYRGPTPVAWELLTSTNAGSSAATNITPPVDTTGADLIIVTTSSAGVASITDSEGNVFETAIQTSGNITTIVCFYCANPTTSTAHTFSVYAAAAQSACLVLVYRGAANAPLDQTSMATAGNVSSIQVGPITPTVNNALVITAAAANIGVYSVDSDFTIQPMSPMSGIYQTAIAALIQGSAAVLQPTWTTSSTYGGVAAIIASFKPA